ncbi:uncharacterized protein LOC108673073 [Hyalella azteca]|uniref:Uncharacterized protein LOC108673073 n=1 Tax=Hyalella azteca TaxID=294128 RepID=A0A8B7NRM5_HYAAZ|nr:uncharacterized protein LOC108673073 [Hyalella azteca]
MELKGDLPLFLVILVIVIHCAHGLATQNTSLAVKVPKSQANNNLSDDNNSTTSWLLKESEYSLNFDWPGPKENHLKVQHNVFENQQKAVEQGLRNARIFAFRSYTSRTLIVSSTVLALSTCVSSINTVACVGRRRRKRMNVAAPHINLNEQSLDVLYPSLMEAEVAATTQKPQPERMPKNIFTIWTTGFTTVTFLTTSYYQGITVSVSLACNPGNAVTSCFG